MNKAFTPRPLIAGVAALSLLLQPLTPLFAANNVNSTISNVNVINLTANVDWDYDTASPVQSSGTAALTKTVVRNQILRETARSVYLMTEGRHRVGTIFVYKNSRFGKNVDIQIVNKDGRSNANVARWQVEDGTSTNFLSFAGKAEELRTYARVIAHELGHYVYGFLDEYREEGAALTSPGSPSGADFTRTSIMNNHELFTRLTTAADYSTGTAAQNNTAQARGYATDRVNLRGGSHWEMLTRDPAGDPAEGKGEHGGHRVFFDAFKTAPAPASIAAQSLYFGVYCDPGFVLVACGQGDISRDQVVPVTDRLASLPDYNARLYAKSGGVNGVDAVDGAAGTAFENFRVVFADSPNPDSLSAQGRDVLTQSVSRRMERGRATAPSAAAVSRHVLVLDRTLPAAAFAEAQTTADNMLQRAANGSQWAIVLAPATTTLVPMTPIESGRTTLVAAVANAKRSDGILDVAAAYALAAPLVGAGRSIADSASIELLTAQGTLVASALGTTARAARISINSLAFQLPSGAAAATVVGGVSLQTVAQASGGTAIIARNAEQATKSAQRVQQEDSGEVFALLATDVFDTLASGVRASSFAVSKYDSYIGVQWTFDPADRAKLQFRVVTPAGTYSTLSPASDLADGYALIELDNATGLYDGTLRAEVVASAAVANPVAIDVESVSDVLMRAAFDGGTLADNRVPVLRVSLASAFPIAKAAVTATVYRASDGQAVLSNLVLLDNGVGADSRADDGVYSLTFDKLLPAGDYYVVVQAQTTDTSFFQPNQRFAIGTTLATTLVGAGVGRADEVDVTLQAGAPGVLVAATSPSTGPSSTPSSGGGGCTMVQGQQDGSLLILLAIAVLGLRRKRRGRA